MPDDRPEIVDVLLARLQRVHPELRVEQVEYVNGQFNHVLMLNDDLVVRFPRSPYAATMLAREVAVLRAIRPYVSLPVPEPDFGDATADEPFVGYRMIPGEPLQRAQVAALDDTELQQLADQLASFLRELHAVPLDALGDDRAVRDTREHWFEMYRQVREQLFPHMSANARQQVAEHFDEYLSDPERLAFRPSVRHGDFGASNILWDSATRTLTGVIDFSFTGAGDPAIDVASISTVSDALVERMCLAYPALADMRARARFYRGTYALKEALDGLRDGDAVAFKSGMRDFR